MSQTLPQKERHPPGLYVLFFTEMWERFGFYTMLALFTLYLKDPKQGFSWTAADATSLYSWYLMFVYASPLVGGWIADWKLGYRNSVLIGGVIFLVGYLLFALPSIYAVYAALACLVVGNGFFKPNVSAMVGQLYPEGSRLKERAYNIFYMGINIGALAAPLVAEFMRAQFGFKPAFVVAGLGMVVSVGILWFWRRYVVDPRHTPAAPQADAAAVTADAPPPAVPQSPMQAVPEWKRVLALVVIFLIVIVFWMVFHQNGSTLTYWADDNTAWQFSGTISNAINPFWVITLTFPLVWFWGWLDR
jgi:POT family proton-dependent oligopeptide transporter